jgi:hypothetical protein
MHMKIAPSETAIVGRWVLEGTQMKGDEACRRIGDLVAHHLRVLADSGWFVLYEDPND